MATSPPSYDGNPDKRPLPAGWITQFDPNYKTWFYVNTEAKPPTTTWMHPSGPVSTPSPERRYSPPPMAPPVNHTSTDIGGYNPTRSGGYIHGGYGNNQGDYGDGNSYPQQQPYGGYGGDSRPGYGAGGYEQNYAQQNAGGKGVGGLLGGLMGGGRPGGSNIPFAGGGYPAQQQPQVVYVQQQPPKKSGGMGMGGVALGAGAGLLGGVLLADALDDNDYGGDYGDGDFGGGDW